MKDNNKGYSFVELLITMAIFAIVMLAIIMIMRTSLVSYKDGLQETTMQEEAQIVANQISDLLVDATYIESTPGSNASTYKFSGPIGNNNAERSFTIDHDGNNLWIDGVDGQLLSNQVETFSIDGLERRALGDTSAIFDNSATITVGITYQGRSYVASREVYFRNSIEDIADKSDVTKNYDPFDVSTGSTSSDESESGSSEAVSVLRFHPLDVSAEFNMVYDVELSDSAKNYFVLNEEDDSQLNSDFKNNNSTIEFKHYTVEVNENYTKGLFLPPVSGNDIYVKGKTPLGTEITKLLKIEKVELIKGAGMFVNGYDGGKVLNSTGHPMHIGIKGIHINDALDYPENHVKISYTAKIISNGATTPKATYEGELSQTSTGYVNSVSTYVKSPKSGDGIPLGIMPEPNTGGFEISTSNGNGYNNNVSDYLKDSTKKNELKITFHIDYYDSENNKITTLSKDFPEVVYGINFEGMSLEKYQ